MEQLLGKAMDSAFWADVRENKYYKKQRDELFDLWQKHCENGPILALKYSDFRMFVANGNRSIYEHSYFTRRLALDCSVLLSLIYPEEEKYLVRAMDEIYAICDEYTWCLPAHQTKLEVNNNVHLDLFACETGFALAETYTMLGERLEPLIRDRIRVEIDRRIIKPYTQGTDFTADHMYGWEKGTNNWSAVCMGSVGCTFMLMRPDLVNKYLPNFDKTMQGYLSGFKNDGICTEGCGYWHYGFGFFTVYADMVRKFTEGRVDYFKLEKVKQVSCFIQKMFLTGRTCVSFSDGGQNLSYHLGLLHYLKKEYPDDVKVYSPEYSYNYDGCGRFCLQIRSFTWFDPEVYDHPAGAEKSVEYFAKDSEWFIRRTPAYGFAAKGGNNSEPHNQNDVGTFIFAKNGKQLIADIGAGPYTRQYFSSERYTMYIECSALGHNLPTFGDAIEQAGGQYRAKNTKFEDGVFSLDMEGAYPTDELKKLHRSFRFTDETVTMHDSFEYTGSGKVTERVVSRFPITLEGNEIRIEDGVATYDPSLVEEAKVEQVKRDEKTVCYLAIFTLKDGVKEFEITAK